ncbi:zinc finger, C2H2 type [Trichinella nativa]|uniref:Zinc finger, C2H2 type n=1 Tax=Trichinella nativa TaxID=6335 RepID=A0A1Y3E9E9_9BILA|nr:zinc finger, C2H2 type [Trichinella nativa]
MCLRNKIEYTVWQRTAVTFLFNSIQQYHSAATETNEIASLKEFYDRKVAFISIVGVVLFAGLAHERGTLPLFACGCLTANRLSRRRIFLSIQIQSLCKIQRCCCCDLKSCDVSSASLLHSVNNSSPPCTVFGGIFSEPRDGKSVFNILSMVLFGAQAVPIQLKILLDRLLCSVDPNARPALLESFGWNMDDYTRGYVLEDKFGRELTSWSMCSREEEQLIYPFFLSFPETRSLALKMMVTDQLSSTAPPSVVPLPSVIGQQSLNGKAVDHLSAGHGEKVSSEPVKLFSVEMNGKPGPATNRSWNGCFTEITSPSKNCLSEISSIKSSSCSDFPVSAIANDLLNVTTTTTTTTNCIVDQKMSTAGTRYHPWNLSNLGTNPLTGKKRVQCRICWKTFCDKGALKIHVSAVHLREMHKCTIEGCTMMFSSRRSRNRHSANLNPKLHSPTVARNGSALPSVIPNADQLMIASQQFVAPLQPYSTMMAFHQNSHSTAINVDGRCCSSETQSAATDQSAGSSSRKRKSGTPKKLTQEEDEEEGLAENDKKRTLNTKACDKEVERASQTDANRQGKEGNNDEGQVVREEGNGEDEDREEEATIEQTDMTEMGRSNILENSIQSNASEVMEMIGDCGSPCFEGNFNDTKNTAGNSSLLRQLINANEANALAKRKQPVVNGGGGGAAATGNGGFAFGDEVSPNIVITQCKTSSGTIEIPINEDNPRQCATCGKIFQNHFSVKTHYQNVHLKVMHQCTVKGCTAAFPSKRSRDRHSANQNLHRKLVNGIGRHGEIPMANTFQAGLLNNTTTAQLMTAAGAALYGAIHNPNRKLFQPPSLYGSLYSPNGEMVTKDSQQQDVVLNLSKKPSSSNTNSLSSSPGYSHAD